MYRTIATPFVLRFICTSFEPFLEFTYTLTYVYYLNLSLLSLWNGMTIAFEIRA